jgi:hypothetical protein
MPIDQKTIEEWRGLAWETLEAMDALAAQRVPMDAKNLAATLNAGCAIAREAIPALLAERVRMLALLRDLEWSVKLSYPGALLVSACPNCGGIRPSEDWTPAMRESLALNRARISHDSGCLLAAFLRG